MPQYQQVSTGRTVIHPDRAVHIPYDPNWTIKEPLESGIHTVDELDMNGYSRLPGRSHVVQEFRPNVTTHPIHANSPAHSGSSLTPSPSSSLPAKSKDIQEPPRPPLTAVLSSSSVNHRPAEKTSSGSVKPRQDYQTYPDLSAFQRTYAAHNKPLPKFVKKKLPAAQDAENSSQQPIPKLNCALKRDEKSVRFSETSPPSLSLPLPQLTRPLFLPPVTMAPTPTLPAPPPPPQSPPALRSSPHISTIHTIQSAPTLSLSTIRPSAKLAALEPFDGVSGETEKRMSMERERSYSTHSEGTDSSDDTPGARFAVIPSRMPYIPSVLRKSQDTSPQETSNVENSDEYALVLNRPFNSINNNILDAESRPCHDASRTALVAYNTAQKRKLSDSNSDIYQRTRSHFKSQAISHRDNSLEPGEIPQSDLLPVQQPNIGECGSIRPTISSSDPPSLKDALIPTWEVTSPWKCPQYPSASRRLSSCSASSGPMMLSTPLSVKCEEQPFSIDFDRSGWRGLEFGAEDPDMPEEKGSLIVTKPIDNEVVLQNVERATLNDRIQCMNSLCDKFFKSTHEMRAHLRNTHRQDYLGRKFLDCRDSSCKSYFLTAAGRKVHEFDKHNLQFNKNGRKMKISLTSKQSAVASKKASKGDISTEECQPLAEQHTDKHSGGSSATSCALSMDPTVLEMMNLVKESAKQIAFLQNGQKLQLKLLEDERNRNEKMAKHMAEMSFNINLIISGMSQTKPVETPPCEQDQYPIDLTSRLNNDAG